MMQTFEKFLKSIQIQLICFSVTDNYTILKLKVIDRIELDKEETICVFLL